MDFIDSKFSILKPYKRMQSTYTVQELYQLKAAEKDRFGISKPCETCAADAVTEVLVESERMVRKRRFCTACLAKEGYP